MSVHLGYLRFLLGLGVIVAAVWVGLGREWGAVALAVAGALIVGLEVVAARGRPRP